MKNYFGIIFCLLFSIFYSLFFGVSTNAAQFYFGSVDRRVATGEVFEVGVFADSDAEAINAVSGTVVFPTELLTLKDVLYGNSVINFWLERPSVSSEVNFSGIVPGGWSGSQGLLFSLVFEAKQDGQAEILIKDGQALKHDGKGTSADLTVAPLSLSIISDAPGEPFLLPFDDIPPEEFTPTISQNSALFDNQWFVVFSATDKQSGIDHYEFQEQRGKNPKEQDWQRAESPHLLPDQNLNSRIFVKAIDRAGNERIATLPPTNKIPLYEKYAVSAIIFLVIGFIIVIVLWRKRNTKKSGARY